MSDARTGVLHEEHALLGASFEPSETTGLLAVRSYAREAACAPAAGEARLTDLTGAAYLLLSGSDAEPLAYAAFAGSPLPVGECAFSATLSGDGALLSMPLVARCGDTEFVVIDPSPRGEALAAWTGLLARAESDGVRAFPLVSICDASEMLVPLALCGPAAEHVLSDYLHGVSLPAPGQVRQLRLDAIGVVVVRPGAPLAQDVIVVLVPPARARVLWRSLLSFTEVSPVGVPAFAGILAGALPWGELSVGAGPERVSRDRLVRWGLVRDGGDFVGGRALA
ncbi:MAG: aminomethyl transferase family protein [Atopobiaceae bacterium]|nr:aminomethyl transferase family protein [Atopobiaceae bacterium]